MGVLIRYPDDPRELAEKPDATRITIRGHKPPRPELINYALVGASAFGMAMLVPQMKKCRDRYHLRGVVSRTNPQGANFARENGVEVLASSLDDVLADPDFHLMVIATRHHEHADQVDAHPGSGQARVRRETARDHLGSARPGDAHLRITRAEAAADGRVQPPLLAGAATAQAAGRRSSRAAGHSVSAERRLHPARQLGAGRAGRRPQPRRGLPHVRRVSIADRLAGQVDRRDVDRSGHLAVPEERQLRGHDRLRGRQRRHSDLHVARVRRPGSARSASKCSAMARRGWWTTSRN